MDTVRRNMVKQEIGDVITLCFPVLKCLHQFACSSYQKSLTKLTQEYLHLLKWRASIESDYAQALEKWSNHIRMRLETGGGSSFFGKDREASRFFNLGGVPMYNEDIRLQDAMVALCDQAECEAQYHSNRCYRLTCDEGPTEVLAQLHSSYSKQATGSKNLRRKLIPETEMMRSFRKRYNAVFGNLKTEIKALDNSRKDFIKHAQAARELHNRLTDTVKVLAPTPANHLKARIISADGKAEVERSRHDQISAKIHRENTRYRMMAQEYLDELVRQEMYRLDTVKRQLMILIDRLSPTNSFIKTNRTAIGNVQNKLRSFNSKTTAMKWAKGNIVHVPQPRPLTSLEEAKSRTASSSLLTASTSSSGEASQQPSSSSSASLSAKELSSSSVRVTPNLGRPPVLNPGGFDCRALVTPGPDLSDVQDDSDDVDSEQEELMRKMNEMFTTSNTTTHRPVPRRPEPIGARKKEATPGKVMLRPSSRNHGNVNYKIQKQMQPYHSNQYQNTSGRSTDENFVSGSERKDDMKMEIIYKEKDLDVDSCGSSEEFDVDAQALPKETSEFKRKSRPLSAGNNAKSDPIFDATLSLSNGKVRNAWASRDDVNDSQQEKRNVPEDLTSAQNEIPRSKVFENSESLCSSDEENVPTVPLKYPPAKSEKMPKMEEIETHKACNDAIMCKATKDYHPDNERYLSFSKGDIIYCQFINDDSDLGFGFKKEDSSGGRSEGFFAISYVIPVDERE